MKNFRLAAVMALLAFLSQLNAQNTTTRNLSSFNKIEVSGGFAELILEPGSNNQIALDLNGCAPEDIITEVRGSALKIGSRKGSARTRQVKLRVTYNSSLTGIASSGSTKITAVAPIKSERLKVAGSGSGDFNLALDVRKFDLALSGSSDCQLSGQADQQGIAVSGSGNVDAGDLKGTAAEVAVSGSGNVVINVSGDVHGQVSGSGNVENKAAKK